MDDSTLVPPGLTRESIQSMYWRWQMLRNQGAAEATNVEFSQLSIILKAIQQAQYLRHQNMKQNLPAKTENAKILSGETLVEGAQVPQTSQVPQPAQVTKEEIASDSEQAVFTPEQLTTLRNQILAFKLISRNLPVPANIQQALFVKKQPSSALPLGELEKLVRQERQELDGVVKEKALETSTVSEGESTTTPLGSPKVESISIPTLGSSFSMAHQGSRQRTLIPSMIPSGVDPKKLFYERKLAIAHRIANRISELENLPSTLEDIYVTNTGKRACNFEDLNTSNRLKLKALIELKSLKLLDKQKMLRDEIIYSMAHFNTLTASSDRAAFRRMKKRSLKECRLTEALERQHRTNREQIQKQKQVSYLQGICSHGYDVVQRQKALQAKIFKLGRSVLAYHSYIEKEESRRLERTAKQRLQALKADDEEAYLKLLDQAKDTRITHLLKQTNAYLDSLAQAVKVQQNEFGPEEHDLSDEKENDDKKADYYNVAHRIKEAIIEQPSLLLGGNLKEYQLKGLQWMVSLYNNRLNGILADEMGLGKTIQTISLIAFLIEKKRQNGPFLIIVPLSTLTNWTLEFEKWAPSVSKIVYKGPPLVRKHIQHQIRQGNFQVLLTTYEYVIKDRPILGKIKWVYMIVDEGHRMKNTQSKLSYTLTTYYSSKYRLILTGTPLQNNLPELWALLNFVLPKIFNSVKSFDEWFNTPFANTGGQDKIELSEEESILVIRRLHKVLRPFLLRRLKKDVESELPDKVEKVIKCQFSALQSKLYSQMRRNGMLYVNSGEKGRKGLQNIVMQLRKICNHPYVFEEVENIVNPEKVSDDNLWRVSGKFDFLDRVLPKFFRTGHRVLIFFQMTTIMNIMEDYLHFKGYKYLRLDGSTKADDRSAAMREFNHEDSDIFIFLLSTRAGGLGLNLQSADTVIIFDSDWNPHQDLQAQDRAHRIGQTKEVRILRLITEKSVEENILARAQYKLDIDGKVIQAGKFDNKSTAEEREAFLRSLLETENDDNADEENETFDDDELNEIIARNDEELSIFREMDEKLRLESPYGPGKKLERLMSEEELPEVYRRDDYTEPDEVLSATGRGARERAQIHYDDDLTEEQWLEAIDTGEFTSEETTQSKREKSSRRQENKSKKQKLSSPNGSVSGTDVNKRKRNRLNKTNSNNSNDDERRKRPKVSLTSQDKTQKSKSKNSTNSVNSEESVILKDIFQKCYNAVVSSVDPETNHSRAELFLELPNKRIYPDYYILIKNPIALNKIKKRLDGFYYNSLDEFKADFHQMFENARTYNEEGSMIYEDANALEDELNRSIEKFGSEFMDKSSKETSVSSEPISNHINNLQKDFVNELKPLCGIVVCCTSIPSEIKTDLALKASKLGAIYTQDLTSQVTHLIAGKLSTTKYKYVTMYRVDMKIMHIDWIFDIYKQWLDGDDIDFSERKHTLPPFYNLLICVTNIPVEQRVEIEEKIVCFGGKYTPDLTKDTTHLIAAHASGRKYEFGVKWGIKIISPEWFWQSIKRGACLEERLFSLQMNPEELGKGAWFPLQEGDKDENKQLFMKKKIKKVKLCLSQEIWNNIVNEDHIAKDDIFKETSNPVSVNVVQDIENDKLNGMFFGLYFYAWAFDTRKVTEILENIIKSHDGVWCRTTCDFPDTSVHIYIIVSHDLPKSSFLNISNGCFVTEWWIERCLHHKRFIEPSEHLLCKPLPCSFPLEGMQDFSICLTGFSGIDLLHISKLIVLLGSRYYESLNNKRNLLIYNTKSKKSRKYLKAKDWNIRIVTQDWLWEIVKQGRVINFDEWERKKDSKENNNFNSSVSEALTTKKLGFKISKKLDDSVTHIISDTPFQNVCQEMNISNEKYKIMSSKWILECQTQLKRLDNQDLYNISNANDISKDSNCERMENVQKKNDVQLTNINMTDLLKKQDIVLERKKMKEKIKGRSTNLSLISTNIPIISCMPKIRYKYVIAVRFNKPDFNI
ncbi:hypothetical protein PORY_001988 [Pneumocystis oryctolagi]|uniref:Uncharacterized protein n=1 Tax=Pneumocystis oryctolagi TaxID=42067 RepID=A0ACB7CAT7_9ASCO|nr:hypothetical protein PORY_001988 [Pneumocystis oryctolagi]